MFSFFKKNPNATLEKMLGYRFKDRQLLELALTHGSCRHDNKENSVDNERLEFLGDAVLGFLLADIVYKQYADYQEGVMTILRSRVVNETGLAVIARKIKLGYYIRLGHGERAHKHRDRDSLLGDTLEAVFGALYLDAGIKKTAKIFKHLFGQQLQTLAKSDVWEDNPKGKLQQVAQSLHHITPTYTVLSIDGPAHARVFNVEVAVGEHKATGNGNSKQNAQVAAARTLLSILNP